MHMGEDSSHLKGHGTSTQRVAALVAVQLKSDVISTGSIKTRQRAVARGRLRSGLDETEATPQHRAPPPTSLEIYLVALATPACTRTADATHHRLV